MTHCGYKAMATNEDTSEGIRVWKLTVASNEVPKSKTATVAATGSTSKATGTSYGVRSARELKHWEPSKATQKLKPPLAVPAKACGLDLPRHQRR